MIVEWWSIYLFTFYFYGAFKKRESLKSLSYNHASNEDKVPPSPLDEN